MSGSILRTELIPADGRVVIGPANFFFLLNASLAVTIDFYKGGTGFGAVGVGGGYIKRNVETWDRSVITGTPGTSVTYFTGIEQIAEDDTDFRTQIATIAGITLVSETPSAALSSPAAVNVANGAASSIAANAARRRISIGALSTNTGSLFVQAAAAGAGRGLELQPGLFVELRTTAAIDVRNDSGAAQDYTTLEET